MSDLHPLLLFRRWLADARRIPGLSHPAAFCLSTVDAGGHPDARYIDLKGVGDDGFLFGTRLDSPKARAIGENPHVAMTFWWDALGRQVRITGTAARAPDDLADALFVERSHQARAVSLLSPQSRPLDDPAQLKECVEDALRSPAPTRPEHWAAFRIRPTTIEFLSFDASRLHERHRYVRNGEDWVHGRLHP